MHNTKKRGFTIVELVIVIAVIAILAAVLIPTFSNVVDAAKDSAAVQEAHAAWLEYITDLQDADFPKGEAYIQYGTRYFKIEGIHLYPDVLEAPAGGKPLYTLTKNDGKLTVTPPTP